MEAKINDCVHINFDELNRYFNINENNLSNEDIVFIEDFEDRNDHCPTCYKRVQLYMDIFVEEKINEQKQDEITEKIEKFFSKMKDELQQDKTTEKILDFIRKTKGEIIEFLNPILEPINPMHLSLAHRGAKEEVVCPEINLLENYEINKNSEYLIKIPFNGEFLFETKINGNERNCQVVFFSENKEAQQFNLKKSEYKQEIYMASVKLNKGEYSAVVIDLKEHDVSV